MAGKFKPKAKKILVVFGVIVAVFTIIGIVTPSPEKQTKKELVQATADIKEDESSEKTAGQVASAETKPKVTIKTVKETIPIPFQTITQNDPGLASSKSTTAVKGVNGEMTISYKVTYKDGIETGREKISESVTKKPIDEVKKLGTKVVVAPPPPTPIPAPAPTPPSNCHSSYSSPCVPNNVSDVDCAGGSGNGPAYVSGPVYVVGPDEYDLDRDGNGIGCE